MGMEGVPAASRRREIAKMSPIPSRSGCCRSGLQSGLGIRARLGGCVAEPVATVGHRARKNSGAKKLVPASFPGLLGFCGGFDGGWGAPGSPPKSIRAPSPKSIRAPSPKSVRARNAPWPDLGPRGAEPATHPSTAEPPELAAPPNGDPAEDSPGPAKRPPPPILHGRPAWTKVRRRNPQPATRNPPKTPTGPIAPQCDGAGAADCRAEPTSSSSSAAGPCTPPSCCSPTHRRS
jgi:hypothetical protein